MKQPIIAFAFALAIAFSAPATGQSTEVVTVPTGGGTVWDGTCGSPSASHDGQRIAFVSSSNTLVPYGSSAPFLTDDIFLRDRASGQTTLLSLGLGGTASNGLSRSPAISADGAWVAFATDAYNLPPKDMNGVADIYVHDVATGAEAIMSVSPHGIDADAASYLPSVSADGRFVAFATDATTLQLLFTGGLPDPYTFRDVYVRDRDQDQDGIFDETHFGAVWTIPVTGFGTADSGSNGVAISADGRHVVYDSLVNVASLGDTNVYRDVYVKDLQTGALACASLAPNGPADHQSGLTGVAISDDGRYIAFDSQAYNLLGPGNDPNVLPDVYWHDRDADGNGIYDEPGGTAMVRASLSAPDSVNKQPAISGDGRFVAFATNAANLHTGPNPDYNGVDDVFVFDVQNGTTETISINSAGNIGNAISFEPSMSGDGTTVAFTSDATDLLNPIVPNGRDIFARDRGNSPYGFGQVSSQGVAASMTIAGTPSASSPSPFDVGAVNVINNKNGLLFYGYAPKSSPFGGGTMLVAPPRKRTPVQFSGGNPPPDDTSGVFSYDFNARIQSGIDPSLLPGADVYAQYWYRDPQSSSTTGLSDAVHFVIEP